MKKFRLGVIGCGHVGAAFLKLWRKQQPRIKRAYDIHLDVVAVCDRGFSRGERPPVDLGESVLLTDDWHRLVGHTDVDAVVELIGGLHPALEIARSALTQGKHHISANKDLIATYGQELLELATAQNRAVLFEAAVMAGVPVIKLIAHGLAGHHINGLYGIVNGTCNYILDRMAQDHLDFQTALKEAQDKGYAEPDPSNDLHGKDAAYKLAILSTLSFGSFVAPKEIFTEGISHISQDDIAFARSMNLTIKLLAVAKKDKDRLEAHVHPTLIGMDHTLSGVHGIRNALALDVDPVGEIVITGEGAGPNTAAAGVFNDVVLLALWHKDHQQGPPPRFIEPSQTFKRDRLALKPMDEIATKYYLRFMAVDKPGVLAQICNVLGRHNISINSVNQRLHNPTAVVPVVMLTEKTSEQNLKNALDEIRHLSVIKAKPVAIRIEKL